jgi:hypothetical protein
MMMKRLAALTLIIGMSGCASTSQPIFSEIALDASNKRMGRGGPPGGGGRGGMRRGPGGEGGDRGFPAGGRQQAQQMGSRMQENAEAALTERLEEILGATQYCEHGYFIIDKSIERTGGYIFGECKAE